ncbi:MAG: hypothetical protein KA477_01050 [Candidatus Levybacteria bacterium]|nr:hypothetical protein [Candidatus Levybacteria bacterium]
MKESLNITSNLEDRECPGNTPYVVSADLELLLGDWAERSGYRIPESQFFIQQRSNFSEFMKGIYPGFEMVSEKELSSGIKKVIDLSGLSAISLDGVYYRSVPGFNIARIVDETGNDKGLGKRAGSDSILSQFRQVKALGISQVALVDDVIFSGELMERVCNVLEKVGIDVPFVAAGIGIGDGVQKLSQNGRSVVCVREYKEVIDEICERDFYPGVPLSGRRIRGKENIGAPYILPFGNPVGWASIPEESKVIFSKFCLDQTIQLFGAIEEFSSKSVTCLDVERGVIGMPRDNTRFTDFLALLC